MKTKYIPEDFQVEEIPAVKAGKEGRFTLYKLTKKDVGTPEALKAIGRIWKIHNKRMSYGGLKDRHAVTVQYITIAGGPMKAIKESNFELEPLGKLEEAYTAKSFSGNKFTLVIRKLDSIAAERTKEALLQVKDVGIPNYFDDQRFGSVGKTGEYIAHKWLKNDFERALWLALADPTPSDRSGTKKIKKLIQENWKDWPQLKAALPKSSERSIISYLCDHPEDFKGAFARLRRDLRAIYFAAFQSFIWNQTLAKGLEKLLPAEALLRMRSKSGEQVFPRVLDNETAKSLSNLTLSLPCARIDPPEGLWGEVNKEVLAALGLEWRNFRVQHLNDVFFAKAARPAFFTVENLVFEERSDEFFSGSNAMHISFELGRGMYATMFIKRVWARAADA